jgi:nitroreductase
VVNVRKDTFLRLDLSPDELLTTTRAVRRRLDFDRPVPRGVIEECLHIAQQAPSASNGQMVHFVVVTDQQKKDALAEIWRRARPVFQELPISWANYRRDDPDHAGSASAMAESADYAVANLHRTPVLVVPCVTYRTDHADVLTQALVWGGVMPAVWSFCLAARERGLGTCLTMIHLACEREAAQVLGIPFEEVMQVAFLPVAYSVGVDFQPERRDSLDQVVHWNEW